MKKKMLSVVAAFAAFCCVQSHAYMDWSGFYVGASGAASFHDATERTFMANGAVNYPITEFKAGGRGSLFVGYQWNQFRAEVEGAFREHAIDKQITRVPGISSEPITDLNIDYYARSFSGMFNAYYDVSLRDNISAYIGGGVGVAYYELKTEALSKPSYPAIKREDTVFAWQVMGGLSYAVTEMVDLFCGYRFFAITKPDSHVVNFAGTPVSVDWDKFPYAHEVEAGVRIRL